MDQIREWWVEERAKSVIQRLKEHDFEAIYLKTRQDASEEILKHVSSNMKIGVGGSVTIRELGILERLKEKGNIILDHWVPGLKRDESIELRRSQMTSDLFLSSANAVTLKGEIVNIDGIGNRINSISFGPKKVILVAGYNKIVGNLDEAIQRIKNVAAPLNARRLNIDVPCAKTGRCVDCNSPNRICRVMVILERRPSLTDMLIILVGEELGF